MDMLGMQRCLVRDTPPQGSAEQVCQAKAR